MNFSISDKDKIIIGVVLINLFATIYTVFNPKREDTLFGLYSASVSSLYAGLVFQQQQKNEIMQSSTRSTESDS